MNPSRLLRTTFLSVLALALIGGLATVQAQDIFVSTTGDDANDGTAASNPKATIQAGIDAASAGETVQIEDGFYDESTTLDKRVNLKVTGDLGSVTNGTVEVRDLTLNAGDDFGGDNTQTNNANRAELFNGNDNLIRVTSSLEVASGFYETDDDGGATSNLQVGDGASLIWSAGDPSTGNRFEDGDTNASDNTAVALASAGGYSLEFANGSDYSSAVNSSQIPGGGLGSLTVDNSGALTLPSDLPNPTGFTIASGANATLSAAISVNGTFSNSGSFDGDGNVLTANGSVENSGTVSGTIALAGGSSNSPASISGSSAFDVLRVAAGANYSSGSAITVTGDFELNGGSIDVSGDGLTALSNVIFAGGSITTNSSGQLTLNSQADQTIELARDSDESVRFLTVDKPTSVNLNLEDTESATDRNQLIVSRDFNFTAGRLVLGDNRNADLRLTRSATLGGIIQDANSTGDVTLDPNQSSSTIAGNGIVRVPLNFDSSNDLTFSELATVNLVRKNGSGDLTFSQEVSLEGNLNFQGGNGNVEFSAGTASSSTGNVNLRGAASGAEVVFGGDATTGEILASNAGTVTFDGAAETGAVNIASDGNGNGSQPTLSEEVAVVFGGSGNTVASVDIGDPDGPISGSNDARVSFGGSATITGDAAVDRHGASGQSATLNFADVDAGASSTVEGALEVEDQGTPSGAGEILVDDGADSGAHSVTAEGSLTLSNDANATFSVDSRSTFTFAASNSFDASGFGSATLNLNGTFAFTGDSNQNANFAGTSIGGLVVNNSRPETGISGGPALSVTGDVTTGSLVLTDGQADIESGNTLTLDDGSGDNSLGSITRSGGSLDVNGTLTLPSGGDFYDLTYANSGDITTGSEVSSTNIRNLSFEGSGAVTLDGNLQAGNASNFNGSLTVESSASVVPDGNTFTVLSENTSGTGVATVDGSVGGGLTLNLTSSTAEASVGGGGSISSLTADLNGSSSDSDLTVSGELSIADADFNTGTDGNDVNLSSSSVQITNSLTAGGSAGDINFPEGGLASVAGATSFGDADVVFNRGVAFDSTFSATNSGVTVGTGNFDVALNGENVTFGNGLSFTFDGNGAVSFSGSSAQTLAVNNSNTVRRIEIDNSNGVTLDAAPNTLVANEITLTAGEFNVGDPSELDANPSSGPSRVVVVSGSLAGGGFQAGQEPSTLIYRPDSDLTTGIEFGGDLSKVRIEPTSSDATITTSENATVNGSLILTSGTFATSENLTIGEGATVTRTGGSLAGAPTFPSISEGDTGITLRYVGSSDVTTGPELPGSFSVSELIVDNSDLTVTADTSSSISTLTLNSGTLDLNEDSLSVFENASVNGSLQASQDGAVILEGGGSSSEIDGTYTSLPTVIASKDQNFSGVFQTATIDRVSSATFSENVAIDGNLIAESGNLVLGNSQVDDVSVSGDFTVASGARRFSDGGNVLAVAGDYDANPGATNVGENFAGDGYAPLDLDATVVFNGSESQTVFQRGAVPGVGNSGDFDFSGLEVNNSAGVTFENDTRVSTLTLQNGIADVGENTLDVDGGSPSAVDRIGGSVEGTLERDLNAGSAGNYVFPLSAGGDFREATIVTTSNTLGNPATVTVSHQDSAFAGNQGLPFTTGSDGEEVEVNAKAPIGWTVSFDSDAGTPAAGEAPDFRFRAQGLEGIGDVNQIRVISRAGEGETGNPFSVAGTHEDALFSGGIPLAVSSGVGGFDISNTQQFTFGSDSAVNDFADADQPAGQVAISGSVNYPTVENGELVDGRALEGVEVEATSGDVTATATTDADGNFTIDGLDSGDYEVTANVDRDVSNVSIGDAQRTVSGFAGTEPFAGAFQEEVADVNASGTANATDALRIAFFDLGSISSFEAGSFLVDTTEVTLGSESESGVSIRVAEFGDADLSGGSSDSGGDASLATTTVSPKSSAQTAAKSATESASDANRVAAGETFEVPVRVDRGAEVGSYSLSLEYDTEKATFEGISSGRDDIITNGSKEDGTLQVGWFDRSGESTLELTGGSELVTLRFSAAEGVEGAEFAPEITSGEINGPGAKAVAAGVETQAVRIAKPAPDEFALNGSYPNPASQQATVEMDLPVRAQVTVEVYNTLGQRVQTVEQSMSAGAGQTVQLDASQLASGQYFYRVKASLDGNQTRETGRLTIVK